METMKLKSLNLKPAVEGVKMNRTFDFHMLYKNLGETSSKVAEKRFSWEGLKQEKINGSKSKADTSKTGKLPNKWKKKVKNESLDLSQMNVDGRSLELGLLDQQSRNTSTPKSGETTKSQISVKSIMKNSSLAADDSRERSVTNALNGKRKKRHKSVSFMLEDTDEVIVKKTKSDKSLKIEMNRSHTKIQSGYKDKSKKFETLNLSEKENKAFENIDVESNNEDQKHKVSNLESKIKKTKNLLSDPVDTVSEVDNRKEQRKKLKKNKIKSTQNIEVGENIDKEGNAKKLKKAKRSKPFQALDGEPQSKQLKTVIKPEVIAEDLENLSIGDNAHTLSNLLDEMTVVDKKKKKNSKKIKDSTSSCETVDLEKIEEGKEKVKWKKRKWNKDKKGEIDEEWVHTSILVENLPLSIMLSYKKLLAQHFEKYGLIKKIGVVELYATEDPKPVFTTTVNFYSDGAATKALEEDNALLEGNRIRVKRPLPPVETTLVVRSYAELTEQSLSSLFSQAGRIRNIRNLVKGRKAMATAFIEFDGPDSVRRAMKIADHAKIGGKKIHMSKFELRRNGNAKKVKISAHSENRQNEDSDGSAD